MNLKLYIHSVENLISSLPFALATNLPTPVAVDACLPAQHPQKKACPATEGGQDHDPSLRVSCGGLTFSYGGFYWCGGTALEKIHAAVVDALFLAATEADFGL